MSDREQSRRRVKTNAPARRPRLKPANSCVRRYIRSAMVSTGPDRRSRRLPSGCPRPGAQAWRFARLRKERPRRALAGAPSTPTRQASTSAGPIAVPVSRVPCLEFSSTSRAARRQAGPCRAMHGARPRGELPPSARLRRAKLCGRRASRVARQRRGKRLGPERVTTGDEGPHCGRGARRPDA